MVVYTCFWIYMCVGFTLFFSKGIKLDNGNFALAHGPNHGIMYGHATRTMA